jgi:hypothetical protein
MTALDSTHGFAAGVRAVGAAVLENPHRSSAEELDLNSNVSLD